MIEKRDISLVTGAILMAAAAAILLMVLLNGPAPAHASLVAATRHVAITGDDEGGSNTCTSVVTPCRTVQHAVDVATGGDEILVATGVYTANGQAQVIYVDETVSIRGGYTTTDWTCNPISFPTTLDAEGQGRVVFIAGNVTSTLEGLRITSGAVNGNGGGIYVGDAHLVLSDCQVVSNVAGTTGGGIALYGSSNLRLTANSIVSNTAIRGNGGGVFLSNSPDATLAGNEIYGNTAITADGGGIYLDSSPNATLTSNNVYSNTAKRSGGGIGLRESAPAALTANRAYSNVAGANGGGVYIDDSDGTTLTANRLYSNTAQDYGGGVYLFSSLTPTLGGNEIYGNRAITWSGGGIALHSCHNARLVSNEVYSNTAKYGGGIGFTNCDDVELTGNNIHDDTAAHGGGGIYLHNSDSATLINNMLVENQLAVSGGGAGILVVNSQARMLHTTLARNGGAEGSGVRLEKYSAFASVVAMTNTILVSHTVGVVAYGGTTATLEATLWGDGAWANVTDTMHNVFTGTLNYPSNPAFVDPDGGDYHIAWGSAARDAGVEAGVSDDVDGEPRPLGGGPDLGADEYGCCVRLEANPAVYSDRRQRPRHRCSAGGRRLPWRADVRFRPAGGPHHQDPHAARRLRPRMGLGPR
jgi:parallel beta-helix repeat protein